MSQGNQDCIADPVSPLCRANPRKWPLLVRYAACKLRHNHFTGTDITPYQVVHGFTGASSLTSALGAFQYIPTDFPHHTWFEAIRAEAEVVNVTLVDHLEIATVRAHHGPLKIRSQQDWQECDFFMVNRPFWEKGVAPTLPHHDGPFGISKVVSPLQAHLRDPLIQEDLLSRHGALQVIHVGRLVEFKFPNEQLP